MSNEMTEFRITSDLSTIRGQVIDGNFSEVQEWLETNLAPYRELAVTQENVSAAKTYRANIRKVRDRIDESRKEAKKAALAAYEHFEQKCKTLTGLCDEAANAIDVRVKAIEDAEKREKIAEIRSIYDKIAYENLAVYAPWEYVYNPKWENKGTSLDAALEELKNRLIAVENDISTIRDVGGSDTAYLLDIYKQTHDIGTVMRKSSEIKALREQEASRKSEEDANLAILGAEDDEPLVTVSFKVTCTKTQLAALGDYMKRVGIKYGRYK